MWLRIALDGGRTAPVQAWTPRIFGEEQQEKKNVKMSIRRAEGSLTGNRVTREFVKHDA